MNFLAPFTSATTVDLDNILTLISRLGVVSMLVLIVYGGFRRWWVFSWVYQDLLERHEKLREDRDNWQQIALRSANLVETMTELKRGGRL
jgi:hypothetical protein